MVDLYMTVTMEDEWEEEEQLVVVELSGMVSSELIANRQGSCKIVDIDSEQPMLQVGRYLFAGQYEDAIGTCVVFEEDSAASDDSLKYKCHTTKKLMLQRTFLLERKEDEPITNRIEMLALQDEETYIRQSVCRQGLDVIESEESLHEESKDGEDQEMGEDTTGDQTVTNTSLLGASSSSLQGSTLDDGS